MSSRYAVHSSFGHQLERIVVALQENVGVLIQCDMSEAMVAQSKEAADGIPTLRLALFSSISGESLVFPFRAASLEAASWESREGNAIVHGELGIAHSPPLQGDLRRGTGAIPCVERGSDREQPLGALDQQPASMVRTMLSSAAT